jgi:hypothetical protein
MKKKGYIIIILCTARNRDAIYLVYYSPTVAKLKGGHPTDTVLRCSISTVVDVDFNEGDVGELGRHFILEDGSAVRIMWRCKRGVRREREKKP